MSVVYRNPFGKKAYQPEVDGERRWWTYNSTLGRGMYVWAAERGIHMYLDLRSKRSAARVERRYRRYLESAERRERRRLEADKRNIWVEITEDETEGVHR